jgi:hypothetical protein
MIDLSSTDVATGLGIGASAASVLAALWGVRRAVNGIWRRTLGRRRAQAQVLHQLACGSSVAFVDELLGTPLFLGDEMGMTYRTYPLKGAWVQINVVSEAVHSFSITITDSSMHYPTKRLTFGSLDVRLGKDSFTRVQEVPQNEWCWIGARRMGYHQHFYFGNPAGYQNYWLSCNDEGAGSLSPLADNFSTKGYVIKRTPKEFEAETTVNTLTVGPPLSDPAPLMSRSVLGPDHDQVRVFRG